MNITSLNHSITHLTHRSLSTLALAQKYRRFNFCQLQNMAFYVLSAACGNNLIDYLGIIDRLQLRNHKYRRFNFCQLQNMAFSVLSAACGNNLIDCLGDYRSITTEKPEMPPFQFLSASKHDIFFIYLM